MIEDSLTDVVYTKPKFLFGIPYTLIHMNELAPKHRSRTSNHIFYIHALHFMEAYELFRRFRKAQNKLARSPGGDMKLVSQACKTPDPKQWKHESHKEHLNNLFKVNP